MSIIDMGITIRCENCKGYETIPAVSEDFNRRDRTLHFRVDLDILNDLIECSLDWIIIGNKHFCSSGCAKDYNK